MFILCILHTFVPSSFTGPCGRLKPYIPVNNLNYSKAARIMVRRIQELFLRTLL